MTVQSQNPRNVSTAAAGATVFPYSFKVLSQSDLQVQVNGVDKLVGIDFTLSGVAAENGGNITFNTPMVGGEVVMRRRNMEFARSNDFQYLGDLRSPTLNNDQDAPIMMLQQLADDVERSLKLPPSATGTGNISSLTPLAPLVVTADGQGIESGSTTLTGDMLLRPALAAANGASLIYASQIGTGAVSRPLLDKLREYPFASAEDYGAVGNGATDDSLALTRMHNALGFIRLQRKTYYCPSGLSVSGNAIVIIGAGKPSVNSTLTGLVNGTGSIIAGSVVLRASVLLMTDVGFDVGDTRFGDLREGVVADAPVGGEGTDSFIQNVVSMGPTGATSSHGFLHEGFNRFRIQDVDVYHHNYGVVSKSRNGLISRIRGYGVKTAAVYLKSSTPASSGGVLSGLVDNVVVSDVISDHFTATVSQPGLGLWVHAEGATISRVTASNIHTTGGRAAARIHADGAQVCSNISLRSIKSTNSVLGWETYGSSFEVNCDGLVVENPSSGEAFETDTTSSNWRCSNINLIITLGGISGTQAALMRGTGTWTDFTARTVNPMLISHSLTSIRGGRTFGTVTYSGEGNLTLGSGVVAASGEVVPKISMRPDNTLALAGVLNPSAAAGTTLATLSGAMNFGLNRYFVCVARTTGNAYTTAQLIASGTTLSILAPTASTLNQIDLSQIIIPRF